MSLEERNRQLEAENASLKALVRRMATELDSRASETREFVGTVEWRGPTAAYEAQAAEINHEIALAISKMSYEAEIAHFRKETDQKGPEYGVQEDHPSIEASGREDAPEGGPDAQGGS